MDDSLVSEGTRARAACAATAMTMRASRASRRRPAPRDAAMALDENAATPHRVSRARATRARAAPPRSQRALRQPRGRPRRSWSGAMRAGEREEGRTGGARAFRRRVRAERHPRAVARHPPGRRWIASRASQGRGRMRHDAARERRFARPAVTRCRPSRRSRRAPVRVDLNARCSS